MKAIKFYRAFCGDYTLRLSSRLYHCCKTQDVVLYAFNNNDLIPIKNVFSALPFVEMDWCSIEDYKEKAPVIFCVLDGNESFLIGVISFLRKWKQQHYSDRTTEMDTYRDSYTYYGHAELIDLEEGLLDQILIKGGREKDSHLLDRQMMIEQIDKISDQVKELGRIMEGTEMEQVCHPLYCEIAELTQKLGDTCREYYRSVEDKRI